MTCTQAFWWREEGGGRGCISLETIWFVWEWCCGHHDHAHEETVKSWGGRSGRVAAQVNRTWDQQKRKKKKNLQHPINDCLLSSCPIKLQSASRRRDWLRLRWSGEILTSRFCVCSAASRPAWPVKLLGSTPWEGHANTTQTKADWTLGGEMTFPNNNARREKERRTCFQILGQELSAVETVKMPFFPHFLLDSFVVSEN